MILSFAIGIPAAIAFVAFAPVTVPVSIIAATAVFIVAGAAMGGMTSGAYQGSSQNTFSGGANAAMQSPWTYVGASTGVLSGYSRIYIYGPPLGQDPLVDLPTHLPPLD